MNDIDILVKKALKTDDQEIFIRYAYAHTSDKWWHLREKPFKFPPLNMVLLFVCGCKKTNKDINTSDHPEVGDICADSNSGRVELLTVEWA